MSNHLRLLTNYFFENVNILSFMKVEANSKKMSVFRYQNPKNALFLHLKW